MREKCDLNSNFFFLQTLNYGELQKENDFLIKQTLTPLFHWCFLRQSAQMMMVHVSPLWSSNCFLEVAQSVQPDDLLTKREKLFVL